MGFSLYNLFKAGLLVTNGLVILHPKRFLSKLGLDPRKATDHVDDRSFQQNQIVGLLAAVSYLKVPLIACNILIIFIEIVAGG